MAKERDGIEPEQGPTWKKTPPPPSKDVDNRRRPAVSVSQFFAGNLFRELPFLSQLIGEGGYQKIYVLKKMAQTIDM